MPALSEKRYDESAVAAALSGCDRTTFFDIVDARVALIPDYLSLAQAETLKKSLLNGLEWQQPLLNMFGREVKSPRLHAWHGDVDAVYKWSGQVWQPHAWVPELAELRDDLATLLGVRFNSCLVNRYRDGQDAMGWHADDEPELGRNPVIASISLGSVRDFDLRHKRYRRDNKSSATLRIPLATGSLLVMFGETQHHWKHQIRRQRNVTGERLNLTFRYIHHGAN